MGILSNKIDRKQLKPGDHIYSWRQAYLFAHHGIYVGDGMVINFTTAALQQKTGTPSIFGSLFTSLDSSFDTGIPCPICGDGNKTRTHSVFSSCLDCFLSGGELYLFQYGVSKICFIAQVRGGTCTLASSDPTEEVIYRALYLLEHGFGDYHVSKNNCEHFAVYCKTGLRVTADSTFGGSGQTASFSAGAKSVASVAFQYVASTYCGLTITSCGAYCYRRLVSDIGYRSDVTKVPIERIHETVKAEN